MNEQHVAATPDEVFAVLLDPWAYPLWVVGARRIRGVDPSWPAPGSRFHHTVGAGPAAVEDSSRIVALDAPRRIELEVRFRPIGVGVVVISVEAVADGSVVRMSEAPLRGPVDVVWGPVLNRLVHWRNDVSLRRLVSLVEARAAWDRQRSEGSAPDRSGSRQS